jgi:hypothetical protein
MTRGKRIARAGVVAILLLSTLSTSAFAAKASDPEPQVFCIAVMGVVVCVPMR